MSHGDITSNRGTVRYPYGAAARLRISCSRMDVRSHLIAKHHAFRLVEAKTCTLRDAAASLALSYRQTLRWWKRYRSAAGSLLTFAITPRGGGRNRKAAATLQAIITTKREHPHRSCQRIAEIVSEDHESVSAPTVRRVLATADLLGRTTRTDRVFKRFEAAAFGERLQMDTTSGAWLTGYRLVYCIAVIDEYSRMLLGWRWTSADSTWENMEVLRGVFRRYGLPQALYTDNASMFKTIRHGRSVYQTHRLEGYETEIQRAMRELGVTMFSHKPYEPQSKGKVERFFRFLQERFIREHTAQNLIELNTQFDQWARWYNATHVNRTTGAVPNDRTAPSVWTPVPDRRKLESAFCVKTTRTVTKEHTISVDGVSYWINPHQSRPLGRMLVEVECTPYEVRVYHRGQFIERFTRERKEE